MNYNYGYLHEYSLAGGETIGTFMTAATFWLCKTPETVHKLRQEIHARYKTYEEIDAASAMKLPYIQAVIHEALRIYPPASQGFPRYSPGLEIDGYYVPKGVCHTQPRNYLSFLQTNPGLD